MRCEDLTAEAVLAADGRVMLGARAAGYPDIGNGFKAQHVAHEDRIGRQVDMVHAFAKPGRLPFDDDVTDWVMSREDTAVVHNWKPVQRWRYIERPEIAEHVAKAARRVKALDRPVMMVLHHEPENDIGSAGTAREYRRMWEVVRQTFDSNGVDNVTWGMAYMNYPKWDEQVPLLWPGDDLVDWVWCNAYGSGRVTDPGASVTRFAALRERHELGIGKPFGVIEWGITSVDNKAAVNYFDAATAWLDTDDADMVRAWMVFDSPGTHGAGGLRLGYDDDGKQFQEKLAAYRRFTEHPRFQAV